MASPFSDDDRLREPRDSVLTSPRRPTGNAGFQAGQRAGSAIRNFFAAPTAYSAMGESMRQRSAAQSQAAAPVRGLAAGLTGANLSPQQSPPRALRPTPAATAAPTAAAPDFSNVRGSASTRPVAQRPTAGSGNVPVAAAAPASPTVGTFNGRAITREDADRLAASLPTSSGPVVTGPNGSFAHSTGPASPVAAPVGAAPAAGAAAGPRLAPRPARAAPYELGQARERRQDAISDIDTQLFLAGRRANTRSGRQLISDLVAAKAGLINAGDNITAGVASGDRDAANAVNTAVMQEQGTNARAGSQQLADLQLEGVRQRGETQRTRIAQRPERIVLEDGSVGLIDDAGSFQPVTGPDGNPVRAPLTRNQGALTQDSLLKSYTDQRTAITGGLGTPEEKAAALAELDADPLYASLRASLSGRDQPPVPGAKRAPDGNWYVQNDDGSYSMVTP